MRTTPILLLLWLVSSACGPDAPAPTDPAPRGEWVEIDSDEPIELTSNPMAAGLAVITPPRGRWLRTEPFLGKAGEWYRLDPNRILRVLKTNLVGDSADELCVRTAWAIRVRQDDGLAAPDPPQVIGPLMQPPTGPIRRARRWQTERPQAINGFFALDDEYPMRVDQVR